MDLKSGYPYWAAKIGPMCAFPRFDAELSYDVAMVGADITGALIERHPHPLTALFPFARLGCH